MKMSKASVPPIGVDPFFEIIRDGEWNACIGVQGDEQNYMDGYLEAAQELVAAVIDKKMMGSRDTLAMPILYNGRHALELSLKFAINRLQRIGAIGARHRLDHDILSHWTHLRDSAIGDVGIRDLVNELEPFVVSLAMIDDDGQELRYAETRDGQKSLRRNSVVNLSHIRSSLKTMSLILTRLKYRVLDLGREHATGSYTSDCSRSDLKEIAVMVGDHKTWGDDSFLEKKAAVCTRFGLSSGKFSEAVAKIRQSRELATLVGIETSLSYLSDDKAIFVMEQWAKAHPLREIKSGDVVIDYFERDIDAFEEDRRVSRELDKAIIANVTDEEISDLEVLFYIGCGSEFGEYYDVMLAETVKRHRQAESRSAGVHHIMSKTNLLANVIRGCGIVGRPTLAAKLQALRPTVN